MSFTETLKKIGKWIWNVIKTMMQGIQNYMKSQWSEWDRQAEEEEKRQEQKKDEPKKDLYEKYDDYYWQDETVWGKKKMETKVSK